MQKIADRGVLVWEDSALSAPATPPSPQQRKPLTDGLVVSMQQTLTDLAEHLVQEDAIDVYTYADDYRFDSVEDVKEYDSALEGLRVETDDTFYLDGTAEATRAGSERSDTLAGRALEAVSPVHPRVRAAIYAYTDDLIDESGEVYRAEKDKVREFVDQYLEDL